MTTEAEKKFVDRLTQAVILSKQILNPFCLRQAQFIKDMTGKYYGMPNEIVREEDRPLNQLVIDVAVMLPLLVARAPKADVWTDNQEYLVEARYRSDVLTQEYERMKLHRTLRRIVMDAFFGVGIAHVGTKPAEQFNFLGTDYKVDNVCATRIDLPQLRCDPFAKTWDTADWIGHTYSMAYDEVMSRDYENKDRLKPSDDVQDPGASKLSKVATSEAGRIYDSINMMRIWIPRYSIYGKGPYVMDCAVLSDTELIVLAAKPYKGPDSGPYAFLGYQPVPSNPMPLCYAAVHAALDRIINMLGLKVTDQAIAGKIIGVAKKIHSRDARVIENAEDGSIVTVSEPDSVKTIELGGVSQPAVQLLNNMLQVKNVRGGNITQIGGLSTSSATATAVTQTQQNADTRVGDLRAETYFFAAEVAEKIAWYKFNDQRLQPNVDEMLSETGQGGLRKRWTVTDHVPGTEPTYAPTIGAENFSAPFNAFNYLIVPKSMDLLNPEAKIGKMLTIMQTAIVPLMQTAMTQGDRLNVRKLVEILAEATDIEEFNEIYEVAPPMPMMPGAGMPEVAGAPSLPNRTETPSVGPNAAPQPMPTPSEMSGAGAMPA